MSDSLTVEFGGKIYIMGPFSARHYLAIRKDEIDDMTIIEMVGAARLDGADPLDLAISGDHSVFDFIEAWMAAQTAAALPPTTAKPSRRRSRAQDLATGG
jgi:hypothetical protein